MKTLILVSTFALASAAFGAADWKVVAESTNCPDKVQILGKEGEKFVKVVKDGQEEKLFAANGAAFERDAKKPVSYLTAEDKLLGDTSYSFTQPAMMESTTPKLAINEGGKTTTCTLKLK